MKRKIPNQDTREIIAGRAGETHRTPCTEGWETNGTTLRRLAGPAGGGSPQKEAGSRGAPLGSQESERVWKSNLPEVERQGA